MAHEPEASIRSQAGPRRPNNGAGVVAPLLQPPALRGATLAFNAQASKSPVAEPMKEASGAKKAAVIAETAHKFNSQYHGDAGNGSRNLEQRGTSPQRLVTVTERIRQLNNQEPQPTVQTASKVKSPTPPESPANSQRIAALAAVGRSASRNPRIPPGNVSKRETDAQAEALDASVKATSIQPQNAHATPTELSKLYSSREYIQPTFEDNERVPPLPPRLSDEHYKRQSPVDSLSRYDYKESTTPTRYRTVGLDRTVPPAQFLSPHPSRTSLRPQHSGISESSLADAITASSIASSRSPSPSRANPPPPPPQRGSRSRLHPNNKKTSRTPSPPKGMKQTMRANARPDDESQRLNKHYHKHRDGGRKKKWRDQVIERERKRYEGVWAANKGLLIEPQQYPNITRAALQGMVLNIVVRDIWSRSRLPALLLEQIWDLVNQRSDGMLKREEFVIGMWLIDQSLKGRKLPAKVSESMWASVQQVPGLQLHY